MSPLMEIYCYRILATPLLLALLWVCKTFSRCTEYNRPLLLVRSSNEAILRPQTMEDYLVECTYDPYRLQKTNENCLKLMECCSMCIGIPLVPWLCFPLPEHSHCLLLAFSQPASQSSDHNAKSGPLQFSTSGCLWPAKNSSFS